MQACGTSVTFHCVTHMIMTSLDSRDDQQLSHFNTDKIVHFDIELRAVHTGTLFRAPWVIIHNGTL